MGVLMKKSYFFLLLMIFFISTFLHSAEINKVNSFYLEQKKDTFIQNPGSFFITEDGYIYILDRKAGNIKIFDNKGKLIKIFGRRGHGPNEFIAPYFSAYRKPDILIVDLKRDLKFVYKRSKKNNLKFIKKALFTNLSNDFHFLNKNELIIAGNTFDKNGKTYSLYKYNLETDEYIFLLPSIICYGYKSQKQLDKAFVSKIRYVAPFGYIDFSKEFIFYVYTGNLRIIRLNRNTKKIINFGKKTKNYIKPYITPGIIKASNTRNRDLLEQLKRAMSYILDLIVINENYIGLIYSQYIKNENRINLIMQIYESSGKFIKESIFLKTKALNAFDIYFYFEKSNNYLYVLDTETTTDFDQLFKIHKFKIH